MALVRGLLLVCMCNLILGIPVIPIKESLKPLSPSSVVQKQQSFTLQEDHESLLSEVELDEDLDADKKDVQKGFDQLDSLPVYKDDDSLPLKQAKGTLVAEAELDEDLQVGELKLQKDVQDDLQKEVDSVLVKETSGTGLSEVKFDDDVQLEEKSVGVLKPIRPLSVLQKEELLSVRDSSKPLAEEGLEDDISVSLKDLVPLQKQESASLKGLELAKQTPRSEDLKQIEAVSSVQKKEKPVFPADDEEQVKGVEVAQDESVQAQKKTPPVWYFGPVVAQDPPSSRLILPPILQFDVPEFNSVVGSNPVNSFLVEKLKSVRQSIDGLVTTLESKD